MLRIALAAAVFIAGLSTAQAEPDVRTLANSCAICHGTDGKPPPDALPRLAGMPKAEFIDAMIEMKNKPNEGRLMSVIARGFSDAEIRALAAYFAKIQASGTESRQ